jgi:hypothetical protein
MQAVTIDVWTPELRERVARSLALLGSANDAEALGACRALQRLMAGAGRDMHTLADFVRQAIERRSEVIVLFNLMFREKIRAIKTHAWALQGDEAKTLATIEQAVEAEGWIADPLMFSLYDLHTKIESRVAR